MTGGPVVAAILVIFALFYIFVVMMGASGGVWLALSPIVAAVTAVFAVWKLRAGDLVGKMTCPWITGIGGAGTGSIRVRRVGAQAPWDVKVLLRIEVGVDAVRGWPCVPDDARKLANMLDEAARKAESR